MIERKACPVCRQPPNGIYGSVPSVHQRGTAHLFQVMCEGGHLGPHGTNDEGACEAWNAWDGKAHSA